ncbi:hypothetical protein VB776_21835 [Arcicella sp. DC2W]|uniref:Uncharacterized protein n=1 Tax=Arcicella gelida TaxID=2984195 RepID=A0ABU5SB51_9BACT|nr:hypothetical protein [Arcicella sp. DC2W]MEA5405596.1 hypothetical protein [Arcicella sp. DC2W]
MKTVELIFFGHNPDFTNNIVESLFEAFEQNNLQKFGYVETTKINRSTKDVVFYDGRLKLINYRLTYFDINNINENFFDQTTKWIKKFDNQHVIFILCIENEWLCKAPTMEHLKLSQISQTIAWRDKKVKIIIDFDESILIDFLDKFPMLIDSKRNPLLDKLAYHHFLITNFGICPNRFLSDILEKYGFRYPILESTIDRKKKKYLLYDVSLWFNEPINIFLLFETLIK